MLFWSRVIGSSAWFLGDDWGDGVGGDDAGQALVESSVVVGKFFVIQPHEVENGGVQVTDVVSVDDGFVAEFVSFAVVGSGFDAGTGHPIGKSLGVVVASAVAALVYRLPSKFAAPDDEGFLKQTALF